MIQVYYNRPCLVAIFAKIAISHVIQSKPGPRVNRLNSVLSAFPGFIIAPGWNYFRPGLEICAVILSNPCRRIDNVSAFASITKVPVRYVEARPAIP